MRKWFLFTAVFIFFGTNVMAFRLNFTPATKYVDGTTITGVTITTDAWQDGTSLGSSPTSPIQTLDNTYGASHTYTLRTRLGDGRVSDNVVVTLTSPLDSRAPNLPGAPYSVTE